MSKKLKPLPSHLRTTQKETRDPSTRWQGLTSRGGHHVGFVGSGNRVPVDLHGDDACGELVAQVFGASQEDAPDS